METRSVGVSDGGQEQRSSLADASLVSGIVAAAAVVIPFGLVVVSPFAGMAAIALGLAGISARASRNRAVIGMTLGAVVLLAAIPALFLLRHVLWRLWVDSGGW